MDIKLTTTAPDWPWLRQTPGGKGQWGPFNFMVDRPADRCDAWVVFESLQRPERTFCSPDRLVFVTGEPESIGRYHPEFLAQFRYVITSHRDIPHPRAIRHQQAHQWFIEKNYDDLCNMAPPVKTENTCLIVSDKNFTEGHRRRLEFVEHLRSEIGDALHVYGRGVRDFPSKWDLLSKYKYAVVLENSDFPDFVTEKLPDAWLAYCYPFYAGCVNADRYFSERSWTRLDFDDPHSSVDLIKSCIFDDSHYARHLPDIVYSREYYLANAQFFPNISGILQVIIGMSREEPASVTLMPNASFFDRDFALERERNEKRKYVNEIVRRWKVLRSSLRNLSRR